MIDKILDLVNFENDPLITELAELIEDKNMDLFFNNFAVIEKSDTDNGLGLSVENNFVLLNRGRAYNNKLSKIIKPEIIAFNKLFKESKTYLFKYKIYSNNGVLREFNDKYHLKHQKKDGNNYILHFDLNLNSSEKKVAFSIKIQVEEKEYQIILNDNTDKGSLKRIADFVGSKIFRNISLGGSTISTIIPFFPEYYIVFVDGIGIGYFIFNKPRFTRENIKYKKLFNRVGKFNITEDQYNNLKKTKNVFKDNYVELIQQLITDNKVNNEELDDDIFDYLTDKDSFLYEFLNEKEYESEGRKHIPHNVMGRLQSEDKGIKYWWAAIAIKPNSIRPKYNQGYQYFEITQNDINSDFEKLKTELQLVIDYLKYNNSVQIKLTGHTDSKGESGKFDNTEQPILKYTDSNVPTDNATLSYERAKGVAEYLVSNGIDKNRISYTGMGETKCVKEKGDNKDAAEFRKVEIEYSE